MNKYYHTRGAGRQYVILKGTCENKRILLFDCEFQNFLKILQSNWRFLWINGRGSLIYRVNKKVSFQGNFEKFYSELKHNWSTWNLHYCDLLMRRQKVERDVMKTDQIKERSALTSLDYLIKSDKKSRK